MKYLEQPRSLRIGNLLLAITLILFRCDSQNENVVPMAPALEKASKATEMEPLTFTGKSIVDVYGIKADRVIMDPNIIYLEATAILQHQQDHEYMLKITEYLAPEVIYRTTVFEVKITPGGVVSFKWPDAIDVLFEYTGYVLHGKGINKGNLEFKGKFDGEKLFFETVVMAKQIQPGIFPGYIEVVEGPIRFKHIYQFYKD